MWFEEDAAAVVLENVEAIDRGDLEALRLLLTDDAGIRGVPGKRRFGRIAPFRRTLSGSPGVQRHVQSLTAEENVVPARYIGAGTFEAPAFGAEPSGKSNGLIAAEWLQIDDHRNNRRRGPGARRSGLDSWVSPFRSKPLGERMHPKTRTAARPLTADPRRLATDPPK